jgi:hypothetical protein
MFGYNGDYIDVTTQELQSGDNNSFRFSIEVT